MKINRNLYSLRFCSLSFIYLFLISFILVYNYKDQIGKIYSKSVVVIKSTDGLKYKNNSEPKNLVKKNGKGEKNDIFKNEISSILWSNETRGRYTVIKYFVSGDISSETVYGITLTTQSTYQYLYHIEEQCKRWEGPISVAVYAPSHEFALNVHLIYYLRFCGNECIKQNISWHLIYDSESDPKTSDSYPFCDIEAMNFDCNQSFVDIIEKYKTSINLNDSFVYPINVVRNVARLSARTEYVMAIDIELYPSVGLVSQFLQLVEQQKSELVSTGPHVYVLPVFEFETGTIPPINKTQLKSLFHSGKANFFHKKICDKCHDFGDRYEWLELNSTKSLNVFRVTKRGPGFWEPFYIGTNAEPLWDERLNWNGGRNKMIQALEMCLMGYDYMILDNAFLVHAPHIIRVNKKAKDYHYLAKKNVNIYNKIKDELMIRYPDKNDC